MSRTDVNFKLKFNNKNLVNRTKLATAPMFSGNVLVINTRHDT